MTEEKKGNEKKEEKKESDNKATKDEKKVEVITAIYKLNLHCQECGNKIKRHLLITQGVQSVEIDIEKGEIKAKGKIDPLKIHKLIEKKSNKKVELVSPKPKPKDTPPPQKNPKEVKQPTIRTITVKVHMHCDKCERDLRIRLVKHKGIFSVKTDQKGQTVTIEGSIEPEKLLGFLRKRVHKNAEIISSKEHKLQKGSEEKDKGKEKEKDKDKDKEKEKEKLKEIEKEKEKEKDNNKEKLKEKDKEKEKEKKGSEEKLEKVIVIQEDAKVEIMVKEDVPYIIHYVYAPQLFSDENPNACCIV